MFSDEDIYDVGGDGDKNVTKIIGSRRKPDSSWMKTPWVPAPGRTTKSEHQFQHRSNSAGLNSKKGKGLRTAPIWSFHGALTSSPSKGPLVTQRVKNHGKKQSALQTSESLVQVVAGINAKREAMLNEWEDYVTQSSGNTNESVLEDYEKANVIAIEAAKEVARLRNCILEIQKQPDISPVDALLINKLRAEVLSKLEYFEALSDHVHKAMDDYREESQNCKDSRKKKVDMSSSDDEETKSTKLKLSKKPSKLKRCHSVPEVSKRDELDHVYRNPVNKCESATDVSMSSQWVTGGGDMKINKNANSWLGYDIKDESDVFKDEWLESSRSRHSKVRFRSPIIQSGDEEILNFSDDDKSKEKVISSLQRRLLSQNHEISHLHTELERLDTQNKFQMQKFKDSVKDKMDEMEGLPDFVEVANSQRIKLAMQLQVERNTFAKTENALKEKNHELQMEVEVLKVRYQSALETMERMKSHSILPGSTASSFRSEFDTIPHNNDHSQKLRAELKLMKQKYRAVCQTNKELEFSLNEMETNLHWVKKHKSSLLKQHQQRESELQEALDESRRRAQKLSMQIQFLRKTYHEMFPIDVLFPHHTTNN